MRISTWSHQAVRVAAIVAATAIWAASPPPTVADGGRPADGHHHEPVEGHQHGEMPGSAPGDPGEGHRGGGRGSGGDHHGPRGHAHPEVPAEYRTAHVPASAWTDPEVLARGQEIYAARCAVCHGASGDGRGPAAAGLALKPADFRDSAMVAEMRGNYLVWRVSEGGAVEPFRSRGSAMPAWKESLSLEDRWAVLAHLHTFSGHAGPHVTSEHPGMDRHHR